MLITGEVCYCCCSVHITLAGLAAAAKPWHRELHVEDGEEDLHSVMSTCH